MAKEKNQRFVRILDESGFVTANELWVDRQTGVTYLFHGLQAGRDFVCLCELEIGFVGPDALIGPYNVRCNHSRVSRKGRI